MSYSETPLTHETIGLFSGFFATGNRPKTPLQALMEAAPGEDPEESVEEVEERRGPLIDTIERAMGCLPEGDRMILSYRFGEGMSLSECGSEIGISKAHTHRRIARAKERLKMFLEADPEVCAKIGEPYTWERAAAYAVSLLVPKLKAAQTANFAESLLSPLIEDMPNVIGDDEKLEEMVKAVAACSHWLLDAMGVWSAEDQVKLLVDKQRDYGHKNIEMFGIYGVVVRLNDKAARYANLLAKNKKPKNESLVDTLMDIFNYCAIITMLRNGTFRLELSDE